MAKKKEQPAAEAVRTEEVTLIQALAFFVDQDWYTNPDGLQEQRFAVPQDVLDAMRRLCHVTQR